MWSNIILTFSTLCSAELEGLDESILQRALRLLEQRGQATIFSGSSDSEKGVKFSV